MLKAGVTRFRPVILTAITTVLGLVPLAIGLNIDFLGMYTRLAPDVYWGGSQAAWWGPMAVAIIAGILFATFLTLVLVPVLYSLVDDFETFFRRHYARDGVEKDEDDSRLEHVGPEPDPTVPERPRVPETVVPEPEPVGARRKMAGPDVFDPLPETS